MFVNPGGPGGSVEKVRDDGGNLDAAGEGRFDVVGWDIRGAGESTHVRCFRSEKRRARFFGNWSIPTTRAPVASHRARDSGARATLRRGQRRASRATSRPPTRPAISTTCGGSSATDGSPTSASPPARSSARPTPTCSRAACARWSSTASSTPSPTPGEPRRGIANQLRLQRPRRSSGFLSLCESAGPARCALAGDGPVAPRVDQLLARLRRAPIPAPSADPPGELTYGDALSAIIVDMSAGPATWPDLAAQLEAAADGDGSALATAGRLLTSAFSSQDVAPGLPGVGLTCADSPAREGPRAWRNVRRSAHRGELHLRTGAHAGGAGRPAPPGRRAAPTATTGPWNASTEEPDPGHRHSVRPEHAVRATPAAPRAGSATRSC